MMKSKKFFTVPGLITVVLLVFSGCQMGVDESQLEEQMTGSTVEAQVHDVADDSFEVLGVEEGPSESYYVNLVISNPSDGRVFSIYPTNAAGNASYFASQAWTWSGRRGAIRSLIRFNLNYIPGNARIVSAYLKLTHHPTVKHSGNNASYIEQVLKPWYASSVNWNNQPTTTVVNRAYLPRSTSGTQNYLVNVTNMIKSMKRNGNYGMMLRLANESPYSALFFASNNNAQIGSRPQLIVRYDYPTSNVPSYEPNYWNSSTYVQYNNKCYNYGCNKRTDTRAQPGRGSGRIYPYINKKEITNAAVRDGLQYYGMKKPLYIPIGKALVAMIVGAGRDFHWYRLDKNGIFWSHKPGATKATNLDQAGRVITDPERCAWNTSLYNEFCGYFFVDSSSVQGQGRENIK